jgi:hypothetical protein
MTTATFAQREVVYDIYMPICGSGDSCVGAPAIIIDSRDGPMVSVLKAYEGGVDFGARSLAHDKERRS